MCEFESQQMQVIWHRKSMAATSLRRLADMLQGSTHAWIYEPPSLGCLTGALVLMGMQRLTALSQKPLTVL